ncbi:MAG: hypothetical protein EZS28_045357 [Streblomastix strix]|uniref:KilA-N domain-containing protein n=1 Tax=Streblomastix strix TaxID=222440 RepID=A0A5J4TKT8_9EUKA|nr:MAG: hypothetical protein EZS28_045357 [Streblomastix strix]
METIESYASEYRGTWIHPKLINYVAIWASPKYASTVGEIMDVINERIQVEFQAQDDQTSMADFAEERIQIVIEQQKIIINEKDNEIKQLKPRAVPQGKETAYVLAVQYIEVDDKNNTILKVRRRNKKWISRKLMQELKDALLYYDQECIAMTKNEAIKEYLSKNMVGIQFIGTKYIFNEDLTDEVIDKLKEYMNIQLEHK